MIGFSKTPRRHVGIFLCILCVWVIQKAEPVLAKTTTEGSLGLEALSYWGDKTRSSFFSALKGDWRGFDQGNLLETGAEVNFLLTVNNTDFSYLEIPESYVSTSSLLGFAQFQIGRKIEIWNKLDDYWALGIWQPRFRWDYLNPQQVGLIGGFFKVNTPYFQFLTFASSSFLPERGANMEYVDGRYVSASRWFSGLPSQAELFGVLVPIQYQLVMPSLGQLTSHPGVSFLARVGRIRGFWSSAAFALKPMNQLLIGYEGAIDLNSQALGVTLHPRVAYHQLYSLDAGYVGEKWGNWISVLRENPIRDITPATWTTQEVSDALALSTGVDLELYKTNGDASKLGLSYLRVFGGNALDNGPFAKASQSTFEPRYPFINAISIKFNTHVPWISSYLKEWSSELAAVVQGIYDFNQQGSIVTAQLKYSFKNSFIVNLGMDVISSD
ncbi:MAG: hypothetical protein HY072_08465, partial [Deltaproteobacteria bacterium]|nr:hypothetical protein [Deltaproteobacteria bacterium]